MVGPSLSDDEQSSANAQLRLGFILLVGISGGLVALQTGGSLEQIGVFALAGLILGWVLSKFLSSLASELALSGGKRGPRR